MTLDKRPPAAVLRQRAGLAPQQPVSATERRNASKDAYLANDRLFRALLEQYGIPMPVAELWFAPPRRWRFDYGWSKGNDSHRVSVAVEVEGGSWIQGRHNRAAGFQADMEKYSEAAARGWLLIRVTPDQLATLYTVDLVRRALAYREA